MESEENIENTVEPGKEVEMDMNDEAGTELHAKTDSREDHEQDVVSSEDQGQEIITDKHEESATQDDEPTEVKPQSDDTDEEVALAHPQPEIALENPLLKSVMEITPPTPRDSSPLQIAIDKIHSSKIDHDGHLTSPTERKEDEVRFPVGVCEFPVGPEGDSDAKMEEEYVEPPMVESNRESEPIELENTKEHRETETVEQPAQHQVAGPKEEEEVVAPETHKCVDTEPNNDEEFVVVSQEDAPIELAEEYPPTQTEEASPETEPATEDSLMKTPDNDVEANVFKEDGELATLMELPKEENSSEAETQKSEDEQKNIVETEHNEIPRESESAAIGKELADIPAEEQTAEAINVRSDALPVENEDRVDTAAEVVTDDVSIADDAKGVGRDDVDVKEPEENIVDEKSEIVESDDNPTTSDVHPAEETLETNEESLPPAHETEPVESKPEILHVTEPQSEESQIDEIEPPVERTNESPDETPPETHREQSPEDDTQQSIKPDFEKSVPEAHTHEVAGEPIIQEPFKAESSSHNTDEHPVDEPDPESAKEVVGQDREHREQTSEEAVEQESSLAEPSETVSDESAEQKDKLLVVTAERTSNEEEQVNSLEDSVDAASARDSPSDDVLTNDELLEGTVAHAVDVEESPALGKPMEDVADADRNVPKTEDVEMITQEPVEEVKNDETPKEDVPPTEISTEMAAVKANEMDDVPTVETHVKEESAAKERGIMPEVAVIAGGVGLTAAAVAESHEGDGSEARESGLEDLEKEVVPGLPHEEFAPGTSVDSEKKLDEIHETPNVEEVADEPEPSQEEIAAVPEAPEYVLNNVLTEPESVRRQESSELKEEVNDPHLETAEVPPEPVSVESVEPEKEDPAQLSSEDMFAPVEPEILAADVEQEKKISVEQETATDEICREGPSTTEPVHGEVTGTPVVHADEPLEDSESKEDTTVTPVERILHGTVAPPSTPLAARIEAITAAGIIGTSVHTIAEDQLKEAVPREGYLRRSIVVEDDSNVPSPEAEDGPTLDDVTDTESVFDVPQVVERVDVSSQKVATRPVVQPSSSMDPIQDSTIASKAETPSAETLSTEETSDSKERMKVEEAAVVAIPVAAAGSIGIMAMATHEKSEQNTTTTPIDHSIPLIRVDTPKPPTLEVHGPFIEPLKHHVQPDEISPPTPTTPHSPTLVSPVLPIPREPTRLPPAPRPVTSYSWLGALFQPISSDVVEAQRTGWVAISTEIVNEPAVRKSSTRLRKKTKDVVVEQVSSRGQKMSDHQGSKTPGTMWNYVREQTLKNGRKRVSGWFKRRKTMEA